MPPSKTYADRVRADIWAEPSVAVGLRLWYELVMYQPGYAFIRVIYVGYRFVVVQINTLCHDVCNL